MNNKELFERAKKVIASICGENHPFILTFDENPHVDPMVDIDGAAGVYWNEETDIQVESILGEQKKQGYQLCKIYINPGQMYYPDMSGEPPSCEFEDVGEPSEDFDNQVVEALKLAIDYRFDDFQQCEAEEDMAHFEESLAAPVFPRTKGSKGRSKGV